MIEYYVAAGIVGILCYAAGVQRGFSQGYKKAVLMARAEFYTFIRSQNTEDQIFLKNRIKEFEQRYAKKEEGDG